jgi:hypothetical protein
MDLPPIRLLRPRALKIDADAPCVLEIHIPINLPHCYGSWCAQIASHLLGPKHTAAALEAQARATSGSAHSDVRLITKIEGTSVTSTVTDKNSSIATGYWKDEYGNEGHGPAGFDAYDAEPWHGRLPIWREIIFQLVYGVRDAQQLREMNPRAFRFDVVEGNINEEFGQEIVFEVGEYTAERRSRHVNDDIAMTMERVDAPLSFSQ